jgi:hypothetical protein
MNTHCFSNSPPLASPRRRSDLDELDERNLFSVAVSGVILTSVIVGAVAAIFYLVTI